MITCQRPRDGSKADAVMATRAISPHQDSISNYPTVYNSEKTIGMWYWKPDTGTETLQYMHMYSHL